MQNYLNLLYREEEREMLPYCRDTGVGIIPWSPVARGVLARPWGQRGTVREGSDTTLKAMIRDRESDVDRAIVSRVEEVAQRRKVPMAAVAVAWVLSKGAYPVVGLSSTERIDQAVAASKLQLTPEEISYLEEPYLPKAVTGY
jgi:aryl-alcohol dehydrogenase-like predicted oxidoreductase